MSSERPKDVNGEEVELGVPYWAKLPGIDEPWIGKFTIEGFCAFDVSNGSFPYKESHKLWRFERVKPPSFEPPSGTVRVRIPVCVDSDGDWHALEVHFRDELKRGFWMLGTFYETAEEGFYNLPFVYVEADVPKPPAPVTVEGTVSQ